MKPANLLLIVVLNSILFTFLFYKQSIGLNLAIFESALLLQLVIITKLNLAKLNSFIAFGGVAVSLITVLIYASTFSIWVNLLSLSIFVGITVFPETKSLAHSLATFIINFLTFQPIRQLFVVFASVFTKIPKINYALRYIKIIVIPVFIVFVFVMIYKTSNPIFEKYMIQVGDYLNDTIFSFITQIDGILILVFILGLILCTFIFLQKAVPSVIEYDGKQTVKLQRIKIKPNTKFSILGLKNEYKSAIFLLTTLNLLILIINAIDINWVWFGFTWNGEYLKQFVHEGTYLLILSILISIAITLYFFRKNLNFYSKNNVLKILSYIWLFQNGILVISVAIRNYWYIHHFALAYLRIGVIFFLIITLFGIITVFIKILRCQSSFYLFKWNSLAIYAILIIMSVFDWDSIIAKYNMEHYRQSFVHYEFLSKLDEKTLPYLDKTPEELTQIAETQKQLFPFTDKYMQPDEFYRIVQTRKKIFIEEWAKQSVFSWNYYDYATYLKLKDK